MMGITKTHTLLSNAATVAAGGAVMPLGTKKTFHLTGTTSAGAGASTVGVEVSNDGVNFIEVDGLALTLGTVATSDSFYLDAPWKFVRGNVKTISGTDGAVTLIMGTEI